jgi:hypothetical protein
MYRLFALSLLGAGSTDAPQIGGWTRSVAALRKSDTIEVERNKSARPKQSANRSFALLQGCAVHVGPNRKSIPTRRGSLLDRSLRTKQILREIGFLSRDRGKCSAAPTGAACEIWNCLQRIPATGNESEVDLHAGVDLEIV